MAGFIRGQFDVTKAIKPGARNCHRRPAYGRAPRPVQRQGEDLGSPIPTVAPIGADDPTYHATRGWDWISVRGRDIGIWSDIYLDIHRPVPSRIPS